MSARALALIAVLALAPFDANAQVPAMSPDAACGTPVALSDGWPIDKPESVGLDGARLCGIAARLKATEANVHSVVVVRRGKLVFEQYFTGYDEPWGLDDKDYTFDATMKHDVRSVSKSVTSLLVGIAAARGLFTVDDLVLNFFPDYASTKGLGWEQVSLRHLLTMSSGMRWDEVLAWTDPNNDEPHLGTEPDPLQYVISKPIDSFPGTTWNYSGGSTDLLGAIIEKTSGKSFEAFAREALFEPLGITDWEWKTYQNGKIAPAAGLRLRPRDMARIGQLVLNRGVWDGKQIVPAQWIADSTSPRFQAIGLFGGLYFYGYQWWLGRTFADGKESQWVSGQGWGGQRVFIVPDLDIVVVTTGAMYASPRQNNPGLDILANYIVPAVRDSSTR
jgi:CubicO group peptidase (beta-lactamase class C family)